jgi:hypothetical protein
MPGRDIGQGAERAAVSFELARRAESRSFCMTQQTGNVPNHAE